MKAIGRVHPNNPNDRRCNSCVDFDGHDGLIMEGQELDCTYCGHDWDAEPCQSPVCDGVIVGDTCSA